MKWTQTSKELNLKTFLFDLYKVGFKSELSGKEGIFDVLESKDWANIIAITENDEVVMVEQFRFGTAKVTLEFPSGAIDAQEEQNLDELEEINIRLIPLKEVELLILNGSINHSLSVTAWYYYKMLMEAGSKDET
jgi:8-oxo-dGTP pyrophosphatase MutT (NUDIX family)